MGNVSVISLALVVLQLNQNGIKMVRVYPYEVEIQMKLILHDKSQVAIVGKLKREFNF
jgi:hypothetical protein